MQTVQMEPVVGGWLFWRKNRKKLIGSRVVMWFLLLHTLAQCPCVIKKQNKYNRHAARYFVQMSGKCKKVV